MHPYAPWSCWCRVNIWDQQRSGSRWQWVQPVRVHLSKYQPAARRSSSFNDTMFSNYQQRPPQHQYKLLFSWQNDLRQPHYYKSAGFLAPIWGLFYLMMGCYRALVPPMFSLFTWPNSTMRHISPPNWFRELTQQTKNATHEQTMQKKCQ